MGSISITNIKSGLTGWARYLNQYKTALCEIFYPHDSYGNIVDLAADLGSELVRFDELRSKNVYATQMLAWRSESTSAANLTTGEKIKLNGSHTLSGFYYTGSFDITVGTNPFLISSSITTNGAVAGLMLSLSDTFQLSYLYLLSMDSSAYAGKTYSKGMPIILPSGAYTIYYRFSGASGTTINYDLNVMELI